LAKGVFGYDCWASDGLVFNTTLSIIIQFVTGYLHAQVGAPYSRKSLFCKMLAYNANYNFE